VFAALFKVIPVKLRRQRRQVSTKELRTSALAVLGLAHPEKVETDLVLPDLTLKVVQAELDSIILNLVSNAVKAIDESKNRDSGRIRISFKARGSDLELNVADNGVGITAKVAEIMFQPLEGKFSEGTGMGLPIVAYIAERYQGTAMLAPSAPSGFVTSMMVTLKGVVE
jgi:signal transduction histidine kinase